ncbi:MarR family winged helix-turn-helix transcriptional regulator [Umezawaea endophytica]|uniref:MarR family transcriptional regulator n=1 Tax=Umezawaea endophytica TaxID=1654476 RepID=A0A9X3A6F8_9PSEU|nr:MarR family transcriptional regulator [Umezawaea endophytica]MCS7484799.1 MarR family transcriptional regulator [Umezawaea endophytica]
MTDEEPLAADEMLLWATLGRLVHALPRVLEDDMGRATGLSMTDFAALLVLDQAPGRRLRMSELATATGLTPSRITRVVDALRAHGLVDKERHGADARGNVAVLTEAGRTRLDAAQPAHLAIARRRVLDHVPPELVPVVANLLEVITAATTDPLKAV